MCTARNGSKQEGNGLETNGTEWQGCGAVAGSVPLTTQKN